MNRDREFLAVPSWHPEAVLCVKAADNAALRKALDDLGVAIADAEYVWTPEMRTAYESAKGG